jgi:SAM-dependent methyltransferase
LNTNHTTWADGDFDYDRKGTAYSYHRRADPRIASLIHAALGDAKTVVNVGAGAGNYEPIDRYVIAIEPSVTMRSQRPVNHPPAIHGVAEALPLDDKSIDASMAILTIHQWSNLTQGINELRRVTKGNIVIMTFDPLELNKFWLSHYVPELMGHESKRFCTIASICQMLGEHTAVSTIPIPIDCMDGFTEAFYARPEAFLNPDVRKAQSAWAFVDSATEQRAVQTLSKDIESGEWDRRFGHFRSMPTFEGALRIITSRQG